RWGEWTPRNRWSLKRLSQYRASVFFCHVSKFFFAWFVLDGEHIYIGTLCRVVLRSFICTYPLYLCLFWLLRRFGLG
ncbi:MAG TPA: hypothetical protein DCE42_27060, partial [Myxococcales bacterium]|nr:hypothetical protein [Myxococcales bacterium]